MTKSDARGLAVTAIGAANASAIEAADLNLMLAPARLKPAEEHELATPAREITSRHGVDRRSLLPPQRVMTQ